MYKVLYRNDEDKLVSAFVNNSDIEIVYNEDEEIRPNAHLLGRGYGICIFHEIEQCNKFIYQINNLAPHSLEVWEVDHGDLLELPRRMDFVFQTTLSLSYILDSISNPLYLEDDWPEGSAMTEWVRLKRRVL